MKEGSPTLILLNLADRVIFMVNGKFGSRLLVVRPFVGGLWLMYITKNGKKNIKKKFHYTHFFPNIIK